MPNWKWILDENHPDNFYPPEGTEAVPVELAFALYSTMMEKALNKGIEDNDFLSLQAVYSRKESGWEYIYLDPLELARLLVRLSKVTDGFVTIRDENPESYDKIVQLNQAIIKYIKSL